ncbi:uncharacterized protein N7482_002974 [Penicillium canariense]|uniref:Cytochrome P450 n=1 Tax=Penicillium canariense TaxID=189055 RepID=A0A9W9IIJ6_9EURO|nr:uncharacterized protein N7482_002974 [Penicillium canariense]KAJ5177097.1 hypothetical protein N7482_002974 [Penicillium canariense]
MHTQPWLLIPALFLAVQLILRLSRAVLSPLKDIPGPFWTRFTSLWYFSRVRHGQFEQDNIKLHRQYGAIVRIAPNQYSIDDISAIKTIYGPGSQFAKSAWYDGWKHPQQWTLFADRDIKRHADTRKQFANLYSMSSLVHYEAFVDHCAGLFMQRLGDFADKKQSFNLGRWFQCYAFDVIGNITFGERFGFLDRGEDIDGAIDAVHRVLMYSTMVGIYPEWHPRLFGLLSKFKWSGASGRAYIAKFVREKIRNHETNKIEDEAVETIKTQNFLEKLILAREKNPAKVTDYHLFIMAQTNVAAGSDTTAISLSAIMWHLLQNRDSLNKLRAEIDEFAARGNGSLTFKDSQDMPYFQAVMKEALRMHSATGLPMWRVVPAGGAQLGGRFFSEGTVVGANTWVAHYDERVFPNARAFRPERWLEAEAEPERLKEMNQMYMPFGLGSRICIGKHVSILEMSKLIPRLLQDFEFTPLRTTWSTQNYWFVKPTDFEVQVKRRTNELST